MAEGTYEYECMRAELLGIEKPNYDEFMQKKKEQVQNKVDDEEVDIDNIKEVDLESEGLTRVSGKLEELNTILKKTQSKISKMKASCGSVAGLLKNRLGTFSAQSSLDNEAQDSRTEVEINTNGAAEDAPVELNSSENGTPVRKSDLAKALDKDLSRLDGMIEKAENSQYAMAHQAKEMKKFMK